MRYSESDILAHVRTVIDQNQQESEIDGIGLDHDTLELDDIIRQHTVTSAQQVLMSCPLRMISQDGVSELPKKTRIEVSEQSLDAGVTDGKDDAVVSDIFITANAKGKAIIQLPTDYLRLTLVEMDGWKQPVRVPTLDTSELRMMVNSDFKGIRPTNSRPCAVEGQNGGKPVLELYGADEGKKITQGQYVAMPAWTDGGINIPKTLHDAVIYQTAALTLQTIGSPQWQTMMAMAQQLSGVQQQEKSEKK